MGGACVGVSGCGVAPNADLHVPGQTGVSPAYAEPLSPTQALGGGTHTAAQPSPGLAVSDPFLEGQVASGPGRADQVLAFAQVTSPASCHVYLLDLQASPPCGLGRYLRLCHGPAFHGGHAGTGLGDHPVSCVSQALLSATCRRRLSRRPLTPPCATS